MSRNIDEQLFLDDCLREENFQVQQSFSTQQFFAAGVKIISRKFFWLGAISSSLEKTRKLLQLKLYEEALTLTDIDTEDDEK